jgi:hypothetical protein
MTEPTYEELKARLAELEAKQQRTGSMSFKVSDKGGVSVYGLGRFPVTLYPESSTDGFSERLRKGLPSAVRQALLR